MYDELIKRLREEAEPCDRSGCVQTAKEMRQAADAIEELRAAVEGYEANTNMVFDRSGNNTVVKFEPKWIPVTERLPEKNQIVVVVQHGKTWDYGQFRGLAYSGGNIHKWNWKNNTTKTVDYWMPKKSALPEPPKEET